MSYRARPRGMVALIKIRIGCVPTVRHGTVDKETSAAVTGEKLAMPRNCPHRTATQNLQLRHGAAKSLRGNVFLRPPHCSLKLANFRLQ